MSQNSDVICAKESVELRIALLNAQMEHGDWREADECVLDEMQDMYDTYEMEDLKEEKKRLEQVLKNLSNWRFLD